MFETGATHFLAISVLNRIFEWGISQWLRKSGLTVIKTNPQSTLPEPYYEKMVMRLLAIGKIKHLARTMLGMSSFGMLTSLDAWGRSPNVRSSSRSTARRRGRGSLPQLPSKAYCRSFRGANCSSLRWVIIAPDRATAERDL